MKYFLQILIILIATILIYFGFFSDKKTPPPSNMLNQWEAQTDEQPPIAITVTPIELGRNAPTWKFEITFDTHASDLNDDPLRTIVLWDDVGNSYPPTAWEGPGPGGHHRNGVLIFNSLTSAPKYIELIIKNVGGIAERKFKWIIGI